jgi:hypothetical protein
MIGCDQARVPKGEIIMNDSPKRHHVKTPSLRSRDHFGPWPISAGELVSLIDLGWSDNHIARYFGARSPRQRSTIDCGLSTKGGKLNAKVEVGSSSFSSVNRCSRGLVR